MLGLKRMLMCYGIEATGVRVAEEQRGMLSFPCILHVKDDFVVGIGCEDTHIIYKEKGERHKEAWSTFGERWDGLALVVKDGKGGEPDYERNLRKERMERMMWWGGALVLCGMLAWGGAFQSLSSMAMTVLGMGGFVLSLLLAEKEVKGTSRVGDKLCGLFGTDGCNPVSSSIDGNIWGTLSLSSVGLGYFGAQMVALSLLPDSSVIVAAIGVVAMLFCPWSIVVQWKRKQWCGLCLIVVVVLFLQGGLGAYMLQIPQVKTAADVVALMALGIIMAHKITRGERMKMKALREKWAFQAFRDERAIFTTKLNSQPWVKVEEKETTQHMGHGDAPHRLTVVTSDDCPHCQTMVPRVERLVQHSDGKLSLDYIVLSEMTDHQKDEFIQRTGITGTPTILIDGHPLPKEYKLEEILYVI